MTETTQTQEENEMPKRQKHISNNHHDKHKHEGKTESKRDKNTILTIMTMQKLQVTGKKRQIYHLRMTCRI